MNDYFFALFCNQMRWTKGFISKWRKGKLRLFRYKDVKVAILNDHENRRVLVWYFYEPTKKLMKIAYHGYFTRHLSRKIAFTVNLINTDDNYREIKLFERRSFSYKAEFKRRNF